MTGPQDEAITPLRSLEEYPIPTYQFSIYIDDPNTPVALFQSVSEMEVKRDVEPLSEGGQNDFAREFPKAVSYGHITLQTGLTSNDFFYKWMLAGAEKGRASIKDFTLVLRRHNPDGSDPIFKEVKRWDFSGAFPVSWKLPELSVKESDNIIVESLELSFDYFLPGQTA